LPLLEVVSSVLSGAPMLLGVFSSLAPLLDSYGYLAVGGLLLAENVGVPLPGETILIAAALYAGAGQLNIALVALIALVACIVGDNAGYALGRYGGRAVVLRYGQYVLLTEARLDAAQRFFDRHGRRRLPSWQQHPERLRRHQPLLAAGRCWAAAHRGPGHPAPTTHPHPAGTHTTQPQRLGIVTAHRSDRARTPLTARHYLRSSA
jgi:hypothetical protein